MEVLRGCKFIEGDDDGERTLRSEVLTSLAAKCAAKGLAEDAFACLDGVLSAQPPTYSREDVSKVIADTMPLLLEHELLKEATALVALMLNNSLILPYNLLRQLVTILSEKDSEVLVHDLVRSTIEAGWYDSQLTTPYSLNIFSNLTDVELNILLKHHIEQVPRPPTRDMEVVCPSSKLLCNSHHIKT